MKRLNIDSIWDSNLFLIFGSIEGKFKLTLPEILAVKHNSLMPNYISKSHLSEPEIVAAILKRNLTGAQALYDNCQATLLKIIFCSVNDLQIAQLILEKTLIYIWSNMEVFLLQDKRFLLWAAGVAKNMARQPV